MGTNNKNKSIVEARDMAAGLLEHYAGQTLPFHNTQTPVADVITQLNTGVAQIVAMQASETTYKELLAAVDAMLDTTLSPLLLQLRTIVKGAYGVSSPTLADFGIAPRKARVPSTEVKAAAAAKAKVTRALRGTKGPRQRAAIHAPDAPATPEPTEPAPLAPAVKPGGKVG